MKQQTKRKIALVSPQFKSGGGEAVLAWTIQALKDTYNIIVISLDEVKPHILNLFYGTHLAIGEFTLVRLPLPFRKVRPYLLKRHLVMRFCVNQQARYDLFFSMDCEMDFGTRGIQYVHFPVHTKSVYHLWDQKPEPRFDNRLRLAYRNLCTSISGYSEERMKQNVTLTNSEWTASLIKLAYGIKSRVVYPPVGSDFPPTPWHKREKGFVCLGRISPEKDIERVIEILRWIREQGFDVHLHLAGPFGDKLYTHHILELARKYHSWVSLEGYLDRQAFVELIARHRFGIHGFQREHFGIVIAEMAKAGCIPFVPNEGGQAEIVKDPRLLYGSTQEAVEKIMAILRDEALQLQLSEELVHRAQVFSVERFMQQIRETVEEFFAARTQEVAHGMASS